MHQTRDQKKNIPMKSIKKYQMEDLDSRRLDYIFDHKEVKNPFVTAQQSLNDDLKGRRRRVEGSDNFYDGKRRTASKGPDGLKINNLYQRDTSKTKPRNSNREADFHKELKKKTLYKDIKDEMGLSKKVLETVRIGGNFDQNYAAGLQSRERASSVKRMIRHDGQYREFI
jgi:hypothetical protein